MRSVSTGYQDFRYFREKDLMYVDKSELISRILDDESATYVFTRPRRFGKSVNMSMLYYYFDPKFRGNTFFDGLKVSELRPDDPLKNTVPVIRMDLSQTYEADYGRFLNAMGHACRKAYEQFYGLTGSDVLSVVQRRNFERVVEGTSDECILIDSLNELCGMIHTHCGTRPIVLIDEYDSPVNNLPKGDELDRTLTFLKKFYSSTFKTNDNLFKGVLTGVLPIAKSSMFSGFNNATMDTVADRMFGDMFGFTQTEVEELCEEVGCTDRIAEIRSWYDGYRIGNSEVFNPWSLSKYIQNGFSADTYWGKTSNDRRILEMPRFGLPVDKMMVLASGSTVECKTDVDITFSDLGADPEATLCLLLHLGYLTADSRTGDRCMLRIPNMEVRESFRSNILRKLEFGQDTGIVDLCRSFFQSDAESVRRILGDILMRNYSVRIAGSEGAYQSLLLGMLLYMQDRYLVRVDVESGNGYPDILMESRDGSGPNIIIETKQTKVGSKSLDRLADSALDQIIEKDYAYGLTGRTDIYGIAFRGKKLSLKMRTIG